MERQLYLWFCNCRGVCREAYQVATKMQKYASPAGLYYRTVIASDIPSNEYCPGLYFVGNRVH